jgi:hypothetical protein
MESAISLLSKTFPTLDNHTDENDSEGRYASIPNRMCLEAGDIGTCHGGIQAHHSQYVQVRLRVIPQGGPIRASYLDT